MENNARILKDAIALITNVVDATVYSDKGKGVLMGIEGIEDTNKFDNVEFFKEVTSSIIVKKIRDKFKV